MGKVELDKFYTRPEVAKECVDHLLCQFPAEAFDIVLEPSAGNGSFLQRLVEVWGENVIAIDVEPEHPDIVQMDFFRFQGDGGKRCLVIGNPPFGRVCSLAVRFFNHAAEFADVIAFIIPCTFRRKSIQNKLDKSFWLVSDMDIPSKPCAFTPKLGVKCCFQVWERRAGKREIVKLPAAHDHWAFLKHGPKDERGQPTPPGGADFALRAYGSNCGEIRRSGLDKLRPKSWHWIKSNIEVDRLVENMKKLDFSISQDTARQDSLGQKELVQLYCDTYDLV